MGTVKLGGAIRLAMAKIDAAHPALAEHLRRRCAPARSAPTGPTRAPIERATE